jgi:pimeloyl-ACP methyl ester carboxylesterase
METTESLAGATLSSHRLRVPLDHDDPSGETIEVFAREVAAPDGRDRPFLLFLQGGPGQESPRPVRSLGAPAWLERALQDYRVIMLDQRGTGLSTPYGPAGSDPEADAQRLTHFRADSIVKDAELLRQHLGASTWSLLGQSFGGFCALHYLTVAPDSLQEVIFTGGLPPVGRPIDDVYSATFRQMHRLNNAYHRRFPGDADRLRALFDRADAGELRTPGGDPISRRLLSSIGHPLGMDGGAEEIHFLLERDPDSVAFSHDLAALLPFTARAPLYAVLHESSYADGGSTSWSSNRVQPDDFRGDSLLLGGEHLFPWHFEDDATMRPYQAVASILAEHEWPRLYDADVLRSVDVPCSAIIYADDPYVDRVFSEETADLLPSMRRWVTDEHLHNGLRTGGAHVLDRLIRLAKGLI